MATTLQRRNLLVGMDYLLAHRGQVHYPFHDHRTETIHHVRSLADVHTLINRPQGLTIDCSQAVTMLLLAVGCKNPNGGATDGYTGTLLANLTHYTDGRQALVGALVVFGPGTGHHVAMVHTPDPHHGNPLLWSQGQESDPRLIYLTQEQAYQPHPHTFLSIAKL